MDTLESYHNHGNNQIEILFRDGDENHARDAFDHLRIHLPDVMGYFNLSDSFPKIRGVLVPDRNEFDRLVRDLLLVEIEVPSNPARIAQAQKTDMVLLSPSAYAAHSTFDFLRDDFHRLLIHECIHMFEEFLSPDIESIPGWWSEGLAVYFSDQWQYEDEFRRAAIEGVASKDVPRIKQIERDRKLAYDWGWTLVKFIENAFGKKMILQIVRECSDGKVFSVIGEDLEDIELHWTAWMNTKGSLTEPLSGYDRDHLT